MFPGQEKAAKTVSTALIQSLKFEVERSGLDFSSTRIVIFGGSFRSIISIFANRLDLKIIFETESRCCEGKKI